MDLALNNLQRLICHKTPPKPNFFGIFAGVLQGETLAPYLFIICLDYVLRTSIGVMKENSLRLKLGKKQTIPRKNDYGL